MMQSNGLNNVAAMAAMKDAGMSAGDIAAAMKLMQTNSAEIANAMKMFETGSAPLTPAGTSPSIAQPAKSAPVATPAKKK
jgi:hypothetical protein